MAKKMTKTLKAEETAGLSNAGPSLQVEAETKAAAVQAGGVAQWGYKKGQQPRIFNLAPGEKLPDGWSDTMPKGEHPHEIERAALGVGDDD